MSDTKRDFEFICTIPDGAKVRSVGGEIIAVHPDHPPQRVDREKKRLVPVVVDWRLLEVLKENQTDA